MSAEHEFRASLIWQPSGKKFSYKEYSRLYTVKSAGKPDFIGTAAPAFFGSKYNYNPEDLLVVSLSACHMLTYLAFAANSKIEVLSYEDAASGTLFEENKITKFKEVTLRPKIKVPTDTDLKKATELHDKAHHACFIANSVNFPVHIVPVFES